MLNEGEMMLEGTIIICGHMIPASTIIDQHADAFVLPAEIANWIIDFARERICEKMGMEVDVSLYFIKVEVLLMNRDFGMFGNRFLNTRINLQSFDEDTASRV